MGFELEQKLFDIVASTFDVDSSQINANTAAKDIDGWDSLAHATLIIRVEKYLNVRLPPEEAASAQCLGDLILLIKAARYD
jgi:acyl carrier protein